MAQLKDFGPWADARDVTNRLACPVLVHTPDADLDYVGFASAIVDVGGEVPLRDAVSRAAERLAEIVVGMGGQLAISVRLVVAADHVVAYGSAVRLRSRNGAWAPDRGLIGRLQGSGPS